MTAAAKQILEAAMKLPEDEREQLAIELSTSVHGGFASAQIEQEWTAEIQRRSQQIDDGTAELVEWSEIKERIANRRARRAG